MRTLLTEAGFRHSNKERILIYSIKSLFVVAIAFVKVFPTSISFPSKDFIK